MKNLMPLFVVSLLMACAPSNGTQTQTPTSPAPAALAEKETGTPEPKIMTNKVVKTEEEWREVLTPEQFRITRQKGTERAFTGALWDNKEKGVYHCVACGAELFGSDTKFESGTGWPSFWAPAVKENVAEAPDNSLFMRRTEVLCARCDSHLGHVFDDGPAPTNLRYCINSAALTFEKKEK